MLHQNLQECPAPPLGLIGVPLPHDGGPHAVREEVQVPGLAWPRGMDVPTEPNQLSLQAKCSAKAPNEASARVGVVQVEKGTGNLVHFCIQN